MSIFSTIYGVSGRRKPTGTLDITTNGTYDVSDCESITVSIDPPKLYAPKIALTDDVISIDNSANGDFTTLYRVYVNGVFSTALSASKTLTIDLTTFNLSDGAHEITITANDIRFKESDHSESVTYYVGSVQPDIKE